MTSYWVHEQSESHDGLLDSSGQSPDRVQFDAIVVPTNRPVDMLGDCLDLALETAIPLLVVCSKRVNRHQVTAMAAQGNVEAFAVDLPPYPANPLGIPFTTSSDEDLVAASWGLTRDLSAKRNLGLVLARMLGWQRLMFLDDDIFDVTREDVDALAAGLSDHGVSVLHPRGIPGQFRGVSRPPPRRRPPGQIRQRRRDGRAMRSGRSFLLPEHLPR